MAGKPGRNSTYPLVDRILDGKLEETLRAYQADGQSYQRMSVLLWEQHRLDVNPVTILRWIRNLDEQAASEPTEAA